jgi:hypothetical protein
MINAPAAEGANAKKLFKEMIDMKQNKSYAVWVFLAF